MQEKAAAVRKIVVQRHFIHLDESLCFLIKIKMGHTWSGRTFGRCRDEFGSRSGQRWVGVGVGVGNRLERGQIEVGATLGQYWEEVWLGAGRRSDLVRGNVWSGSGRGIRVGTGASVVKGQCHRPLVYKLTKSIFDAATLRMSGARLRMSRRV